MSYTRGIRWAASGVEARDPRIKASEWAKYKDVIIRVWRQVGLLHMIEYMKHKHNFVAKAHQYKYQIYRCWREDCKPLSEDCRQLQSIAEQGSPINLKNFPHTPEEAGITGNSLAFDPENQIQQRNNQRGSLKRNFGPVGENINARVPKKHYKTWDFDPNMAPIAAHAFTEKPASGTPSSMNLPTFSGPTDGYTVPQDLRQHGYETDSRPYCFKKRTEKTSVYKHDDLGTCFEAFTNTPRKLTWAQIICIKASADFYFACSQFKNAFNIYLLVLTTLRDPSIPGQNSRNWNHIEMERSMLIACARSANNPSDMQTARILLEKELPSIRAGDKQNWEGLQILLIDTLLADICWRQNETIAALQYQQSASRCISNIDDLLDYKRSQDIHIGLMTHFYLLCGSAYRPSSLEKSLDKYYQQNHSFNHLVRKCFEWCAFCFERTRVLPLIWKHLIRNTYDDAWADYLAIFCFLWQQWAFDDVGLVPIHFWASGLEDMSCISAAEMLDIVSATIVKYATPRPNNRGSSSQKDNSEKELIERALAAVLVILQEPDEILAERICSTFIERTKQRHRIQREQTLSTNFHEYLTEHLVATLDIGFLSYSWLGNTENTSTKGDETMKIARSSGSTILKYEATLAPSLSSSEHSSLRRLSVRLSKAKGQPTLGSGAILPSQATRQSQKSSFSTNGPNVDELSDSMGTMSLFGEPPPTIGSISSHW